MVEIGGKPILWHIMKMYSYHGINDFIICCGYKGYVIKEYFANYSLHMSDVTFDMQANTVSVHEKRAEPWKVTLVDTGDESMTGGRLACVAKYVKEEEAFCFTYGDGVGDIDITAVIDFHRQHKKLATLTACYPAGRFGALDIHDKKVMNFKEKPQGDGAMINGGFFSFFTQGAIVFNGICGATFIRYIAVWFVLYLLNILLIGLIQKLSLNLYLAGALATLPIGLIGYFFMKYYVFSLTKINK